MNTNWGATLTAMIALFALLALMPPAAAQRAALLPSTADCCYSTCPAVEGYVFLPGKMPDLHALSNVKHPEVDKDGVVVYQAVWGGCMGYKVPGTTAQADISATAAKCQKNLACTAFTTNGLLYMVGTSDESGKGQQLDLPWKPVNQCFSASCTFSMCVGTYVLAKLDKFHVGGVTGELKPTELEILPDDCVCSISEETGAPMEVCGTSSALALLKRDYGAIKQGKPKLKYNARPKRWACPLCR